MLLPLPTLRGLSTGHGGGAEDLPRLPLSWGYLPQGLAPSWGLTPPFLTYPIEAQHLVGSPFLPPPGVAATSY